MKRFAFLFVAVFAATGLAQAPQPPGEADACKFEVSGNTTKPTITGPDEIVDRVRVVDQPDSPIEILAVDFEGSWLAVQRDDYYHRDKCRVRLKNRSDRSVTAFFAWIGTTTWSNGASGGPLWRGGTLAPGQELELKGCGGGGESHGRMRGQQVRVLVAVEWVHMETCEYYPSRRVPTEWGLTPNWHVAASPQK